MPKGWLPQVDAQSMHKKPDRCKITLPLVPHSSVAASSGAAGQAQLAHVEEAHDCATRGRVMRACAAQGRRVPISAYTKPLHTKSPNKLLRHAGVKYPSASSEGRSAQ